MVFYRIDKKKHRANDLSGVGAYNEGGRWNNAGVYALYTSENRSLALHELLIHADESELPPHLFIMTIYFDDVAPIYEVKDAKLPPDWNLPENLTLKAIGDKLLRGNKYLALKVRSAIMPFEYNLVLNPTFPNFSDLVKIISIEDFPVDKRLM